MVQRITCTLTVLATVALSFSQVTPYRTYGGFANDRLEAIAADAAGNMYVGGITGSFLIGTSSYSAWLMGFNTQGDSLWSRSYTYGGAPISVNSMFATDTGELICGGRLENTYTGMIMAVSSTGNQLWQRSSNVTERIEALAPSLEGGIYAAGSSIGNAANISVRKLTASGEAIWSVTFDSGYSDEAASIMATPDSGALVCGTTIGFGGGLDGLVLKFDKNGALQWSRSYGQNITDRARCAAVGINGGYVVGGSWQQFAGGNRTMLLRLNEQGDTLWTRSLMGYADAGAVHIGSLDDRYAVLVSHADEGSYDQSIVFVDDNGAILDAHRCGNAEDDGVVDMVKLPDGRFAIIGNTYSDSFGGAGVGAEDGALIIAGADGQYLCEYTACPDTMASIPLNMLTNIGSAVNSSSMVVMGAIQSEDNHPLITSTCDVAFGVETFEAPALHVYPVPCTDRLTFSSERERADLARIDLIDACGRVVLQTPMTQRASVYELDVRVIPSGMYTLLAVDRKGNRMLSTRVVKQ